MIAAYEPFDERESQHRHALMQLLQTTADPFSRHQFAPGHVTASCFIVDVASGRLLLHHHRRLDRWLQMGGHVESGEVPLQAALREGREESGLNDLRAFDDRFVDLDVHSIPAGRGEPQHLHFDVRYLATTSEPEAIASDPHESNELAWLAFDKAVELMAEEGSQRVITKIRSLLR
jgi:8-oxo-dGTP pyrophosphatase MutT (NUDIX family)